MGRLLLLNSVASTPGRDRKQREPGTLIRLWFFLKRMNLLLLGYQGWSLGREISVPNSLGQSTGWVSPFPTRKITVLSCRGTIRVPWGRSRSILICSDPQSKSNFFSVPRRPGFPTHICLPCAGPSSETSTVKSLYFQIWISLRVDLI